MDTCTFSCSAGYELQRSNNLCGRSWNQSVPICVALNCSTSPPLSNSQVQSSCDTQYQSTCTTVCVDGYTGVGGSYTCLVVDVSTNRVEWHGTTSCKRGKRVYCFMQPISVIPLCVVQCSVLTNPLNGSISCSLINDPFPFYEDTCNFTCNIGYGLIGNNIRTCQKDGSWSGTSTICNRGQFIAKICCDKLLHNRGNFMT